MEQHEHIDKEMVKRIENLLGTVYTQQYLFDRYTPRKCTKAEKELRKKTIRKLIVAGIPRNETQKYCEYRFGFKAKQFAKYLSEIYQEFQELSQVDSEVNYGLHVERLNAALAECISDQDMANRIRVLKEFGDVFGLKKQNMDLTTYGEKLVFMVSDEFLPQSRKDEQT